MRQCQECGGHRSLLRHNTADICQECDAAIEAEVHERVQVVKSTLDRMDQERTLDVKLQQWGLIVQEVEVLFGYEQRGILTTHPRPSTLLLDYRAQRDVVVRAAQTEKQDLWRRATAESARPVSARA